MVNSIFFAVGFVLFLTFSFGGMSYSSIHRSFLNMHKSLVETSIMTIGENGNDIDPYFNETLLESYLTTYLNQNVAKYATQYKATLMYFDAKTKQMNTNHRANGVKISLYAKVNTFFTYQHARSFSINSQGELYE